MENLHLVPEGENDDLYSGYDYNDPMLEVLQLSTPRMELSFGMFILINAHHPSYIYIYIYMYMYMYSILCMCLGVGGRSRVPEDRED